MTGIIADAESFDATSSLITRFVGEAEAASSRLTDTADHGARQGVEVREALAGFEAEMSGALSQVLGALSQLGTTTAELGALLRSAQHTQSQAVVDREFSVVRGRI